MMAQLLLLLFIFIQYIPARPFGTIVGEISCGEAKEGSITQIIDSDVYNLTVSPQSGPLNITFNLCNSPSTNIDSILRLYNSSMYKIKSCDYLSEDGLGCNAPCGNSYLEEWKLTLSPGKYFIEIGTSETTKTGNYKLEMQCANFSKPTTPSPTSSLLTTIWSEECSSNDFSQWNKFSPKPEYLSLSQNDYFNCPNRDNCWKICHSDSVDYMYSILISTVGYKNITFGFGMDASDFSKGGGSTSLTKDHGCKVSYSTSSIWNSGMLLLKDYHLSDKGSANEVFILDESAWNHTSVSFKIEATGYNGADCCYFSDLYLKGIAITQSPTSDPTLEPTTAKPSYEPTEVPSVLPSEYPSNIPSQYPSKHPSAMPTERPTESDIGSEVQVSTTKVNEPNLSDTNGSGSNGLNDTLVALIVIAVLVFVCIFFGIPIYSYLMAKNKKNGHEAVNIEEIDVEFATVDGVKSTTQTGGLIASNSSINLDDVVTRIDSEISAMQVKEKEDDDMYSPGSDIDAPMISRGNTIASEDDNVVIMESGTPMTPNGMNAVPMTTGIDDNEDSHGNDALENEDEDDMIYDQFNKHQTAGSKNGIDLDVEEGSIASPTEVTKGGGDNVDCGDESEEEENDDPMYDKPQIESPGK